MNVLWQNGEGLLYKSSFATSDLERVYIGNPSQNYWSQPLDSSSLASHQDVNQVI